MKLSRFLASTALACLLTIPMGCKKAEMPATGPEPQGYQQIIDRGQLAALSKPKFIPASHASISDGDWVLGVEIDGITRAYPLAVMNRHEVVNDQANDTPYLVVW